MHVLPTMQTQTQTHTPNKQTLCLSLCCFSRCCVHCQNLSGAAIFNAALRKPIHRIWEALSKSFCVAVPVTSRNAGWVDDCGGNTGAAAGGPFLRRAHELEWLRPRWLAHLLLWLHQQHPRGKVGLHGEGARTRTQVRQDWLRA